MHFLRAVRSAAIPKRQLQARLSFRPLPSRAHSLAAHRHAIAPFSSQGHLQRKLEVEASNKGLAIRPPQAAEIKRQHLPYLWLRDNCRCTQCVNQDTMQRNFNTFEIPRDICAQSVESTSNAVSVTWSDGHQSSYDWQFLQFYLSSDHREDEVRQSLSLWGAEAADSPPTVSYAEVMADDQGVARLTSKIKSHGFVFVDGTPHDDPDATRQLLERIAFVRITHYGGFYDFIPDLALADTAYTNLALAAHTDTTYFTDPAGLQAFHLLSHHPAPGDDAKADAAGGKSLLVDGFHAARVLQAEDARAYEILSTVRLPWHASGNAGIAIAPDRQYPVLELSADTCELHRVRWNNDDRGVVPFGGGFTPDEWYDVARKWDAILRRKECECWIQLQPGKTLIFDNWRVLHGRSAFTGIRRICGAYINRDDFVSRWRNTNFPRSKILEAVIG
ncbi:Trimethyllysine dioxygenase [Lasiosphaeria miniovina]|uniref:Trimethyllysine dioxygenase n=1 Tax=Lasiosphaeria miniovina TaxID=1954250 RepID=A0AA40B493_9PEZI|nr:Trimethyllysine dioxygenase [Lasiosphaeria miniovina]KAK0727335.1 Trimethyllysine dioxygenase [Lasiosphaeria miniovina]